MEWRRLLAAPVGGALAAVALMTMVSVGLMHNRSLQPSPFAVALAQCGKADCRSDRASGRPAAAQKRSHLGVLGRAPSTAANTFGSLASVGHAGRAQTPSLVSFNTARAFAGSGTGPSFENGRTAFPVGHHAGDPKILENAMSIKRRYVSPGHAHAPYYFDKHHDANGRTLSGPNDQEAPQWWPAGKQHTARPYVKWGDRYLPGRPEDEHLGDARLVRAGVNVEGSRKVTQALPLPWLDNSQYDHDNHGPRDQPKGAGQARLRDEHDTFNLRDHGIVVDHDPLVSEKEQGQEDKWKVRRPCTYGYVDRVAGMQTHAPYFLDPNGAKSNRASQYTLQRAGVLLTSNLFDRAMPAPHLAGYDPTRDDGCDQGDGEHIDRVTSNKLPEGQLDVEMEPPHGTSTFVNVFSPDYQGPGKKHLPATGEAHFD